MGVIFNEDSVKLQNKKYNVSSVPTYLFSSARKSASSDKGLSSITFCFFLWSLVPRLKYGQFCCIYISFRDGIKDEDIMFYNI